MPLLGSSILPSRSSSEWTTVGIFPTSSFKTPPTPLKEGFSVDLRGGRGGGRTKDSSDLSEFTAWANDQPRSSKTFLSCMLFVLREIRTEREGREGKGEEKEEREEGVRWWLA